MHPSLYQEMFDIESRHWWFVARREVFKGVLRRHLIRPGATGPRPKVCELGSGCGMLLSEIVPEFDAVGMERADGARDLAALRGVTLLPGCLPDEVPFAEGTFDAVILTDVLEHIEEDVASLQAAARLLRPGGIALVTVPAHPILWTHRDEVHRHHRRYTQESFRALREASGLQTTYCSWFNSFLAPIAISVRLLQRLLEALFGRSTPGGMTDLSIPPGPFNSLLRRIFASELGWLQGGYLPPGLSLLAVLRKSADDE